MTTNSTVLKFASPLAAAAFLACGSSAQHSGPKGPSGSVDPTPLARCQLGGGASNPLVTEWVASEKARLESLLRSQPVFVRYAGCELELVDQCRLEGGYEWVRTTLATDTVDIRSEDELYAKLPIGAAALQGELAKTGRLVVRTRVAGQLRLSRGGPPKIPSTPACGAATHVVSAVSLGAFKLTRGQSDKLGGELDAYGAGLKAGSAKSEEIVREAGSDAACENSTVEAADPNCASPIQLFLTPLGQDDSALPPASAGSDAVRITFPATEDEAWGLFDEGRRLLCELPCQAWVPQKSGYTLRSASAQVTIPDELPFPGGRKATAAYRPEQGSPTLSAWLFWGVGAWLPFPGVAFLVLGLDEAFSEPVNCEQSTDPFCDDDDNAAFFLTGAAIYLALSGASLYYYLSSDEESFSLSSPDAASNDQAAGSYIQVGPGFARWRF